MTYNHAFLKKTRLRLGLSIEAVAHDLCLSAQQVESIEDNRSDFFYSDAIKLVSVKKYAQALSLNETDIFPVETLDATPGATVAKMSFTSNPKTRRHHGSQPALKKTADKNSRKGRTGDDLSNHAIIQKATQFIEASFHHKITLPQLATVTGFSERSIQLIFQKHFKQTPFEYIEAQRLNKAKALIETFRQSKKIADIAHDVGFMHLGRFSVNFKKHFGVSPSLLAKGAN